MYGNANAYVEEPSTVDVNLFIDCVVVVVVVVVYHIIVWLSEGFFSANEAVANFSPRGSLSTRTRQEVEPYNIMPVILCD